MSTGRQITQLRLCKLTPFVSMCYVYAFARKDEAAGNNEPPSGTNALQVRREAQDFRREECQGRSADERQGLE